MSTTKYMLGSSWQRITDGTQTVTIQVMNGVAHLCDSSNEPPTDAAAHSITGFVTITPPVKAWVKGHGDGAVVVIT